MIIPGIFRFVKYVHVVTNLQERCTTSQSIQFCKCTYSYGIQSIKRTSYLQNIVNYLTERVRCMEEHYPHTGVYMLFTHKYITRV